MLVFFLCTDFAAFRHKRSCNLKALFHSVARKFFAIGTCFNAFVRAACNNAVSAPVFRLTSRTGNFFVRHDMIPISDLHPQLCSVTEFFVCLFIWMRNIPWAGSTIISASRYYLFQSDQPPFYFCSFRIKQ